MAKLTPREHLDPVLATATATSTRTQTRDQRLGRLSGVAPAITDEASNPASSKVSSFGRVIDIDFTERRLSEVETMPAPADGFDW